MATKNIPVNYPDHMKRKDPVINLPFYKTDETIFTFYSINELNGPRKVANCTICMKNIEFVKGSSVFSSYTSALKFHLQSHPEQFKTYLECIAKKMKPDTKTRFQHFIQKEHPRVLPKEHSRRRHEESERNALFVMKNLAKESYVENDFYSKKNMISKSELEVVDGQNVALIEFIHKFTNQNVPLRELVGTWDVNASFRKYKRYKCLLENTGNIILDLERLFCENTCFLDPENYDSCPNVHTGDISIFGERHFQQKVKNLDDELDKYPEFILDKSFNDILLKEVKCVQRDGRALVQMNRMLEIILSMITVKKEFLNTKVEQIIKNSTTQDKLVKPHFAIQLWGPKFADFDSKKEQKTKDFEESFFHTYQHLNDEDCPAYCDTSKLKHREPVIEDGMVIYPCNVGGCGKPCECEICNMWNGDEIVDCRDHHPDHPRMFDPDNDIVIRRRIFFNTNKAIQFERPRENSFCRPFNLKLAGMKKKCKACQTIVKDHLKNHHSYKLHSESCQICGHLEVISENSMALTCYICMKKFKIRYRLEDHMNTHDEDKTFSCNTCDKTFPTKFTKERHFQEVHTEECFEYGCELCDSKFSLERNLQRHRAIHDGEPSAYSCTLCDTKFKRTDNLNQHCKEVHGIDKKKQVLKGINDKRNSYKCVQCDSSFIRRNMLERHTATVHESSNRKIVCVICDKSFNRQDNLKRHLETVHKNGDARFTCEKCSKQFDRKYNLKRHEEKLCHGDE